MSDQDADKDEFVSKIKAAEASHKQELTELKEQAEQEKAKGEKLLKEQVEQHESLLEKVVAFEQRQQTRVDQMDETLSGQRKQYEQIVKQRELLQKEVRDALAYIQSKYNEVVEVYTITKRLEQEQQSLLSRIPSFITSQLALSEPQDLAELENVAFGPEPAENIRADDVYSEYSDAELSCLEEQDEYDGVVYYTEESIADLTEIAAILERIGRENEEDKTDLLNMRQKVKVNYDRLAEFAKTLDIRANNTDLAMEASEEAYTGLQEVVERGRAEIKAVLQSHENTYNTMVDVCQVRQGSINTLLDLLLYQQEQAEKIYTEALKEYENARANRELAEKQHQQAQIELIKARDGLRRAQVAYEQAVRKYNDDMASYIRHKRHEGAIKGVFSAALGTIAAVTFPYLAPTILSSWGTMTATMQAAFCGMVGGATSAAIGGGNILEGAIMGGVGGGVTANIGVAGGGLTKLKLQALQAATTSTISTIVYGGNLVKNVAISVGANAAANQAIAVNSTSKFSRLFFHGSLEGGLEAVLRGNNVLVAAGAKGISSGAQCLGYHLEKQKAAKQLEAREAERVAQKRLAEFKNAGSNSRVQELDDNGHPLPGKQQAAKSINPQQARSPKYADLKMVVVQASNGKTLVLSEGEYAKVIRSTAQGSKFDWLSLLGVGSAHAMENQSFVASQKKASSAADAWESRYIGGQFSEPAMFMDGSALRQQQVALRKLAVQHGANFTKEFPLLSERRAAIDFALFLKSPEAIQQKDPSFWGYMSRVTAGMGMGAITTTTLNSAARVFPVTTTVLGFFTGMVSLEQATQRLYATNPILDPDFIENMQNPLFSKDVKERLWQNAITRERMYTEDKYEPLGTRISKTIRENPFETGFFLGSAVEMAGAPVGRAVTFARDKVIDVKTMCALGTKDRSALVLARQRDMVLVTRNRVVVQPGASTFVRGVSGEFIGMRELIRDGYRIWSSKLPGNRGFDIVAVKKSFFGEVQDIIIAESKYSHDGVYRLAPKQMTKKWIASTMRNMKNSPHIELKKTFELLEASQDKITFKGNVLDVTGINDWEQPTASIARLHEKEAATTTTVNQPKPRVR